jgi:hypothetical protein
LSTKVNNKQEFLTADAAPPPAVHHVNVATPRRKSRDQKETTTPMEPL